MNKNMGDQDATLFSHLGLFFVGVGKSIGFPKYDGYSIKFSLVPVSSLYSIIKSWHCVFYKKYTELID